MMKKRKLVDVGIVILTTILLLGSAGSSMAAATNPPNIVFIFADDLGYADLACYGHPYAQTPALDKLATEGARFEQFYVTGITCCPSRTGIMTGLFPARFKKYPADYGFGNRVTITDLLKKRGYQIGHFGKWHMGPETRKVYSIDRFAPGRGKKKNPRGRDAWLFDEAIQFIKNNKSKPFYVNVWGHATHYPVDTHPDLVKRFKQVKVNRKDFSKTMQHKFDECIKLNGNLNTAIQQYLGDVWSLDQNVGRLLKIIDTLGIRKNTIVVFSSDHGPAPVLLGKKKRAKTFSANMLGYAGVFRGGKHQQYEGGVRAPFIIRWPGRIKAGRVDKTNVISGIDWMPTLCRIAGVKNLPKQLDGEDVSDVWLGANRERKKPLFWKTSAPKSSPAMRLGKWKLHLKPRRGDRVELYDLSRDPSESQNIAAKNPKTVARLSAKLKAWVAELPKKYEEKPRTKKEKEKEATQQAKVDCRFPSAPTIRSEINATIGRCHFF